MLVLYDKKSHSLRLKIDELSVQSVLWLTGSGRIKYIPHQVN